MSNVSVSQGRDHTNETRRLATLLEISQALSGVLNLKAALHSVLDILERRHQVAGGAVHARSTATARTSTSRPPAASGCPASAARNRGRATASPSGSSTRPRPVVVPRVSQEPTLAPPPRRRAATPRAVVRRRADHPRPAARRHDRGRARLQVGSRLPALARVLPRRRLDDRAGGEGAAAWSRRTGTS